MYKAVLATIAVFSCQAFAQTPALSTWKQFEDVPMNTFRFIGNHLVCKTDNPNDLHFCSRIGPFKIGEDFIKATLPFGKPYKVIVQPDGEQLSVYIVNITDTERYYWVVGNRGDKISSILVTGATAIPSVSFSTIQLNDPKSKVLEVLGPKYSIREIEQIKGLQWDYAPFPITIEFVNDKVYSMKFAPK